MSNKRELYEKIMTEMAVIVKKQINEYFDSKSSHSDIISKTEDALDDYLFRIVSKAKRIIGSMTPEQLKHFMNSDYDQNSRSVSYLKYGLGSLKMLEAKSVIKHPKNATELAAEVKMTFKLDNFQVIADDAFNLGLPNVMMVSEPSKFETISLIISDVADNFEIIDTFMKKAGYTLIRKFTPVFPDGNAVHVIIYTPIVRPNISDEIASSYLYHVTPTSKLSEIKKSGLIPHARYGTEEEGGIIYPERLFFFTDRNDAENLCDENSQFGEEQEILFVDTDDVAEMMDIFYDPLYGKKAVYVEHAIPAKMIKKLLREE